MRNIYQPFMLLLAGLLISLASFSQSIDHHQVASIRFKSGTTVLTTQAKPKLDSIVKLVKNDGTKAVWITTSYHDLCTKCGGEAWDRAKNVSMYFMQKGVNPGRIYSTTRIDSNSDIVMISVNQHDSTATKPTPLLRMRQNQIDDLGSNR